MSDASRAGSTISPRVRSCFLTTMSATNCYLKILLGTTTHQGQRHRVSRRVISLSSSSILFANRFLHIQPLLPSQKKRKSVESAGHRHQYLENAWMDSVGETVPQGFLLFSYYSFRCSPQRSQQTQLDLSLPNLDPHSVKETPEWEPEFISAQPLGNRASWRRKRVGILASSQPRESRISGSASFCSLPL